MQKLTLQAAQRLEGQTVGTLRRARQIPAIYYGAKEKNQALAVDALVFKKLYIQAGENTIVHLEVDGKSKPVLIHDVQFDPRTDAILHVDFLHINMDQAITTHVPLEFVGTSPAVKDLGGILVKHKNSLTVKCLPSNIPHSLQVDVSSILNFHISVHVKDVQIPKDVTILDKQEETVVTVVPPKVEEAAPTATEAPADVNKEGVSLAAVEASQAGPAAPKEGEKADKKDKK